MDLFKEKYTKFDIAGVVLGAIFGYWYYAKIGCNSEGCFLTNHWGITMTWGALLGYFLVDIFTSYFGGKSSKKREDMGS